MLCAQIKKLVHKKQGVSEMMWLPVETVVLQGTGKIMNRNLGGNSNIYLYKKEKASLLPSAFGMM